MSEASDRGRNFERKVAGILRSKLGARVTRDRRSGAGINKSDISDYYQDIPLHMELKDQETVKVKEWFRQADAGASFTQAPTVVFALEEEVLAVIRFSDLVNFVREIADQKAEIDDLRKPFNPTPIVKKPAVSPASDLVEPVVEAKIERGSKTCRNGHLCDDYGYCMQKGCQYSRGYKKPKAKKAGK
jgi:hypothetical protein